jgi:hypothetical protein
MSDTITVSGGVPDEDDIFPGLVPKTVAEAMKSRLIARRTRSDKAVAQDYAYSRASTAQYN